MASVETQFRSISYIVLIVTLVTGFLLGGSYILVRQRFSSLENTRKKLISQLNAQSTKESMFIALKDRIAILDKVFVMLRPLATTLDTTTSIAAPPLLTSLTYEDQGRMVVMVRTPSIDEALTVVGAVSTLAADQQLRVPQLQSLSMDKDGSIRLSVSFYPVF